MPEGRGCVRVRFGAKRRRSAGRSALAARQATGLALALGIAGSSSATDLASKDNHFTPHRALLLPATFAAVLGEAPVQQGKRTTKEGHFAQRARESEEQQRNVEDLPVQVGETLVVTGDGVNVRLNPNTGATIMMQTYRNTPVTVLERDYPWVRVEITGTGGREGWIHGSLLAPPGGRPVAPPSDEEPPFETPEAAAAGPVPLLAPPGRAIRGEARVEPRPQATSEAEPRREPQPPASVEAAAGAEAPAAVPVPTRRDTAAGPAQTPAGETPEVAQAEPEPTPSPARAGEAPPQVAQAEPEPTPSRAQSVGEAPPEREEQTEEPQISGLREVGGVLTPQGTLVLEPALRLSHSEVDRFTFRGVELIETVLVGVIEAEESDRNLIEASLTTRLGITDRLEIEARIPGLYRNDEVSTTLPDTAGEDAQTRGSSLDTLGLGDVEAAMHYQINSGGPGTPVFVGNLRGKFPTGKGPFEVERDEFGIEEESPTGSGFYGVEPSMTVIYRSDPVVFYGNGGYLINLKRDVDEQIGAGENAFRVGEVDPGDAIRIGFGMGFAVNERTSFSLGYSHDFIRETTTEIDGVDTKSDDLQIGTFSVGFFHAFSDEFKVDLTTEIGATDEATDVSVILRVPFSFDIF